MRERITNPVSPEGSHGGPTFVHRLCATKAHRLLYHSTLGLRVIKKKRRARYLRRDVGCDLLSSECGTCKTVTAICRANMAYVRQSRPYSGRGFQVKSLNRFNVVPSSLGSGPAGVGFGHAGQEGNPSQSCVQGYLTHKTPPPVGRYSSPMPRDLWSS